MQIKFQSKEESKKEQQKEFLKLSGGERIWRFFQLSAAINKFPTKKTDDKVENFIIEKNCK